ncbi:GNAT family N-acetyltransferase [Aliikangiella marina]|uniref:GNAT family N-acetyltransferase n=1 Tax=Aliikangiella marina TaxID=1712262 RepID=A0A545T9I0_9GAMM|nr:GNAT family N-acetyltransferase [Aliikangiella marina]TQV73866.1 GNAT family N-acetyltransferase [Aliikangiella marina]
MSKITTRSATLEDLPLLLEFEQGIIAVERAFDETLIPGHINYYDIGEMIESDNAEVLVAIYGSEIVASGYAKLRSSKTYQIYEQHAYLGFMFVKPEYRGKGVNQLILDGLENWAKEKGISEVRLQVYADNSAAIRAYEKAGFKSDVIEMRREIAK